MLTMDVSSTHNLSGKESSRRQSREDHLRLSADKYYEHAFSWHGRYVNAIGTSLESLYKAVWKHWERRFFAAARRYRRFLLLGE